jgi:hypothetical protein
MWTDTLVEETRKAREEYAAKFNYDLAAIYEDIKKQERRSKRRIVSLLPREPTSLRRRKAS